MYREIFNDSTGRYRVTTSTGSEYIVLLLGNRSMSRKMGAVPPSEDFLSVEPSELRRDGEELELLRLEVCRVGASARFWIQVRSDPIPTLRTTSPVVCIIAID
jgi:hypothetical protein